jgi:hypothetical protein
LSARLGIFSIAFLAMLVINGRSSVGQSVSIFGNAVPAYPAVALSGGYTLGVKFWSTQAGAISGIRFYRGAASPQGYIVQLYSADGAVLGQATMANESGPVPGWQTAMFAAPISIAANTTYVAAYYAPSGQFADDYYRLAYSVTTGPLSAPGAKTVGGNGVYYQGNGFPQKSHLGSNYYVDVLFTSTAVNPYLQISVNPSNPSIASSAPLGSAVATITATWSDGSPFTGTLSFGAPYSNDNATFAISGNNLIINPGGPGVSADGDAIQNVTIVATQ